jgi:hypothetical protein
MTWERMLERMRWRSPFGDLPDAWKDGRMRRSCWPKHDNHVWHIWHQNDAGDQSSYEGGLVKGWGGQMGFIPSEVVSVNGDDLTDGTMYTPTEGDRLATDWETAWYCLL